jgi:ABC-type transporter Mla subunit MlaD
LTDYNTIQKRRNILVGVFVLIATCALIGLIWVFGDLPIAVSKLRSFQIIVQFGSAPGIQKNTPVQLGGYQVGRVIQVMAPEILEDKKTGLKYHQTKVIIAIDKKYINIPSNIEIKLMRRGLGSSFVELVIDPSLELVPMDPNRPETAYLQAGMVLQGSTGTVSEFFPEESQNKLSALTDRLIILVDNANDILGDKATKQNTKAILSNLAQASEQATRTLKEIEGFSASGKTTLQNADVQITRMVDAMVEMSDQLGMMLSELRETIDRANNGDGTAAKFLNDGRLYENLLDSSQELQALLEQLRLFIAESREKGVKIKW